MDSETIYYLKYDHYKDSLDGWSRDLQLLGSTFTKQKNGSAVALA